MDKNYPPLADLGRVQPETRSPLEAMGQLAAGNIDLNSRPQVTMPNGDIATVRSISANFGNGEVVIPTVSDDGRIMTNKQAMDLYRATGRHLGVFDSVDHADAFAQALHEAQARQYVK